MKPRMLLLLLILVQMAACGPSGSDLVPVAELPDPVIYAVRPSELPEVGLSWQPSYNQTTTYEGYKWSYLAYQAYQPGNLGVELETALAVNNDVVLYEVDMHRQDLPPPPQALGNIQNISWKSTSLSHKLGDKSAVWKTTLGELLTPVWWLEFYQGHAYVRISLLGFPDQIAPPILYGLGEIVSKRLPQSVARLRADAATVVATQPVASQAPTSQLIPTLVKTPSNPAEPASTPTGSLPVRRYTAPPGETGMVSFYDDRDSQLTDGVLGSDDILADLGNGTANEWVGWTEKTDPVTLTLTLDSAVNISAIQIGFNHREGLGVFVPDLVTINGTSFTLAPDAIPNNTRADLSFTGPFQGPVVEIALYHRGRGWILVDEVRLLSGR